MAKGRKARDRRKQKELDRRRRLDKKQKRNPTALARQVTPKLADKIDRAYELIRARSFAKAKQLLDRLDKRYDRYPAIVEAQMFLYQTIESHEACCRAAKRLTQLTPRAPEARLMYAQESMFCGRIGIALANYQRFLRDCPDHANVPKAKQAIELIEPECELKIQSMGFDDASLELLVEHDEVLECIQGGQFEDAAQKCLELLERAPNCIPARNNLAIACFQMGDIPRAVQVAQETSDLAPDDRFAEAMLGKLLFLSGNEDQANVIADRIVGNPPTEQDPLAAAIELLSFLGRDEDIVVLSEAVRDTEVVDPRCRAVVLHHRAVAQCRLGDEKAARASWKGCLRAMPTHPDARENLVDLDSGQGHAPWSESIAKWVPQAIFDEMRSRASDLGKTSRLDLEKDYPAVATLIPALLDRGDPAGREIAMKMAAADGSPAMLDALYEFAFGARGPDAMRHQALNLLREQGRVDAGPHRFYGNGKWTQIKLFVAEITWAATKDAAPRTRKLIAKGMKALSQGDYTSAEESFQRVLEKEPDNCSAAYNLCTVWLQRDGQAGRRRARARIEEIARQFPDYHFAKISLAQFAMHDGDLDRASDLLVPLYEAKKLHVSEARALFAAQVQIAIKRREFDSAERSLALMTQIAGEDDANVVKLRRMLDAAPRGRPRLPSWV